MKNTFGARLADTLTKQQLETYVERLKKDGYANQTVNNRLQILAQAYSEAKAPAPEMPRLAVNNARQGFFTRAEWERLCRLLPEDLQDFCRFAYLTGMRFGEIRQLRWEHEKENLIKLPGWLTKSRKARSIAIEGELVQLVERRRKARTVNTGRETSFATAIFHRNGRLVGEFPKSWRSACIAAGLGTMVCPKCEGAGAEKRCPKCKVRREYHGKLFHDFRRTAVRNMVRAGVPQGVAMAISGHKTESVFRRYDIVSEADLAEAMKRVSSYRENVVAIAK